MDCCQTGGNLRRDFERQLYFKPARAFDEILKSFALHELHRIEITVAASTQMEHRGNIWVADTRRCAGFSHKAKPSRFITEVALADDFQCHGTTQIDVERFVSDPHGASTQLDRFPVFTPGQLVVIKP